MTNLRRNKRKENQQVICVAQNKYDLRSQRREISKEEEIIDF